MEAVAGRHRAVAVSASLREHADCDLHARAGDHSGLDRRLDAEVGASGVADRRHPGAKRGNQVSGGLVEAQRERGLHETPGIDMACGDMDVTVEEPRQDCLPGDVDDGVAVETPADVLNQSILDDDVGFAQWRAGSVEDPARSEEHSWHGNYLRHGSLRWTPTDRSRATPGG